MKQEDLDKLFRDKLKERDFEMSESAWNSMEQRLDKSSKKGGVAWAFFLVGIAVAIGTWFFWINDGSQMNNDTEFLSDNTTIEGEIRVEKTIDISEKDNYLDTAENGLQTDLKVSQIGDSSSAFEARDIRNLSEYSMNENAEDEHSSYSGNSGKNNHYTPIDDGGKKENESDDETGLVKVDFGKTDGPDYGRVFGSTSSDDAEGNEIQEDQELEEKETRSERDLDEKQKEQFSSGDEMRDANSAHKKSSSDHKQVNKGDESAKDSKKETGLANGTKPSDKTSYIEEELELLELIYSEVEIKTPNLALNDEEIYIPEKLRSNKWSVEAGLFYGTSSVSKNLSTGNTDWQSAIDFRNANESNVWKSEFGLEFGLSKNSLTVRSGLTKGEFGEDIAYTNSLVDSLFIEQSSEYQYLDTMYWDFVFDTAGVVIDSTLITTIIDSTLIVTIDSTIVSYTNNLDAKNGITSISYTEIPLVFGYALNKGKWEFNPEAGLAIGLLKVKNGYYVSNDNDELIQIGEETILKKTIFNAIYGLRVRYEINPKFKLNVNLGQRRNLNSIFEGTEINQKYTSSFFRFGFSYNF